MSTRSHWLAALSACAMAATPLAIATAEDATPTPAVAVGQATCRACHTVEAQHWDRTVHARVFARPRSGLQELGCEACHGPGSLHVAEPERADAIVAFTRGAAASVEDRNSMCLQCHRGGERIHWLGSVHEASEVACNDCHDPMARQSPRGLLAQASVSETCLGCHVAQRAEFRKRSHMPVLEGKVSCVDCHAPHGSVSDPLLRADDVVALCTTCHAEKRGPFLWEHPPVTENCLECHQAHGSNHERLLNSAVPYLCQQCHAQTGTFGHANARLDSSALPLGSSPDPRLSNRGCVNCHVQIHGSNHPSGARFHR